MILVRHLLSIYPFRRGAIRSDSCTGSWHTYPAARQNGTFWVTGVGIKSEAFCQRVAELQTNAILQTPEHTMADDRASHEIQFGGLNKYEGAPRHGFGGFDPRTQPAHIYAARPDRTGIPLGIFPGQGNPALYFETAVKPRICFFSRASGFCDQRPLLGRGIGPAQ